MALHPLRLGLVRCFALAVLLALMAGCQVADSRRIDPIAFNEPERRSCHSRLGSYALPKASLEVQFNVAVDGRGTLQTAGKALPVKVVRRPDPGLIFCLDHLAVTNASDEIRVLKSGDHTRTTQGAPTTDNNGDHLPASRKPTAFLGAFLTSTEDKSADIAVRLIRAAFTLISGAAQFAPIARSARGNTVMPLSKRLQFDPFDPGDAARINITLTSHGLCIVMEHFTFGRGLDVNRYCNNPGLAINQPPAISENYLALQREPVSQNHPGILYRPRMDYQVTVYEKADPRGRGGWSPLHSGTVKLENLSPVIALGVTRSAFAGRKASFVFDEGALVISCLAKTSELQGVVEIPYEIVRSVVALPTQIIKVRVGAAHDERSALVAEREVLDLQAKAIGLNTASIKDRERLLGELAAGAATVSSNSSSMGSQGNNVRQPTLGQPTTLTDLYQTASATFNKLQESLCGKPDWPGLLNNQ